MMCANGHCPRCICFLLVCSVCRNASLFSNHLSDIQAEADPVRTKRELGLKCCIIMSSSDKETKEVDRVGLSVKSSNLTHATRCFRKTRTGYKCHVNVTE